AARRPAAGGHRPVAFTAGAAAGVAAAGAGPGPSKSPIGSRSASPPPASTLPPSPLCFDGRRGHRALAPPLPRTQGAGRVRGRGALAPDGAEGRPRDRPHSALREHAGRRYVSGMLDHLKANNRAWAARMVAADADFFRRLERQQLPQYLWIGCSDSRVPANEIVG